MRLLVETLPELAGDGITEMPASENADWRRSVIQVRARHASIRRPRSGRRRGHELAVRTISLEQVSRPRPQHTCAYARYGSACAPVVDALTEFVISGSQRLGPSLTVPAADFAQTLIATSDAVMLAGELDGTRRKSGVVRCAPVFVLNHRRVNGLAPQPEREVTPPEIATAIRLPPAITLRPGRVHRQSGAAPTTLPAIPTEARWRPPAHTRLRAISTDPTRGAFRPVPDLLIDSRFEELRSSRVTPARSHPRGVPNPNTRTCPADATVKAGDQANQR